MIRRDDSLLLIVDLQARLVPALERGDACVAAAARLIRGARALGVPVLATEHMPERIGETVPVLRGLLETRELVPKVAFGAMEDAAFRGTLRRMDRGNIAICGAEAHVCVLQTALGLAAAGYRVALAEDATASRHVRDRDAAFRRMAQAGIAPTTAETALFEWLGRADAAEFRDILAIVKERDA